ncbi:hypothetical protein DAMA08_012580 [Martiniozyma asiatica (nom. inval.)]|nr:hypothetical protein DAMA08_012580 [Martiniozyma asiatica]
MLDIIIENTGSEPRDVLMSERTALSWIKFSLSLTVIAIAVLTDFRLSSEETTTKPLSNALAVSIVFICLSLGCIFFGSLGYFQMVRGYELHKVNVFHFEYSMWYLFITGAVLLGLNCGLIWSEI